ncbi:hypothetical protein [Roseiflexus sp.]|uniref:hypothetical protein n=1 Tax=Roseiflexus sp. TaxID=2562120 RepID=UPI00398A9499
MTVHFLTFNAPAQAHQNIGAHICQEAAARAEAEARLRAIEAELQRLRGQS